MKMTSGRRKQERQSRALDRLLAGTFVKSRACAQAAADDCVETGADMAKREAAWTARRDAEVATLRGRAGRKFE